MLKWKKLTITDDVYSTRCSLEELMENEEAKAVLEKYLGDIRRTSYVWNGKNNAH